MRRLSSVLACLALTGALLAGCNATAPGRSPLAVGPGPTSIAQLTTPDVEQRAYAAIVVDAETGRVLHEDNAEALRHPASLTKMMTLYLLFEQLQAGRLFITSELDVSANAAAKPATKLGLKAGSTITVDMAIRALCVGSANDVATVVAESLAGSEPEFALAMTRKARQLGMGRTQFANASGLPDPRNVTTARDMAILARALSDRFPQYFRYFATREYSWNGRTVKSTNKLLPRVAGVDGIKTGYVRASGFNLVTSVRRDGRHLVAVVIGGRTGAARDRRMEELIEAYLPERTGLLALLPG